ncbi:MAG: hypothetical protein KDE47_34965, partial [Caldilineaceae bacterium]|nr:hypothetical protein [Caldilineaceae bacterium]
TRLAVIELPNEQGTQQLVVVPGGYAYFLNRSGSIAILNGSTPVKTIRLTKKVNSLNGDLIYNPVNQLIYVLDQFNRYIHVIRGTEVITQIATEPFAPSRLATASHSPLVYVNGTIFTEETHQTIKQIWVISNTQVITQIDLALTLDSFAVDRTTDRVYAGFYLPEKSDKEYIVGTIDGTELITAGKLGVDWGGISAMAVNEQSGALYLKKDLGSVIYWHGDEVARVRLGQMGYYPVNDFIAVDPTRDLAYVGIQRRGPSEVVVLRKGEIVDILRVGFDPQYAIYDARHDYMYIANYHSGTMTVVRGTSIIATLETGGAGPRYIGVDEKRGYIYVSNADDHSIAVFGYGETE